MRVSSRRLLTGALVLLAAGAVALIACYPGEQLTVEDADVVVTLFDDATNFATKLSYAMPDSIVHIVPEGGTDTVHRDFDEEIIAQVVSNMSQKGFARVTDPNVADVFMLLSVTAQDQVDYIPYSWGYWGWYYPYPPGWGWGYYPWYGGGSVYTYRVGTIFMQMLDPSAADSLQEKTPTIWLGALNGMAEGSIVEERILEGIDQAFDQSPYLGDGK